MTNDCNVWQPPIAKHCPITPLLVTTTNQPTSPPPRCRLRCPSQMPAQAKRGCAHRRLRCLCHIIVHHVTAYRPSPHPPHLIPCPSPRRGMWADGFQQPPNNCLCPVPHHPTKPPAVDRHVTTQRPLPMPHHPMKPPAIKHHVTKAEGARRMGMGVGSGTEGVNKRCAPHTPLCSGFFYPPPGHLGGDSFQQGAV